MIKRLLWKVVCQTLATIKHTNIPFEHENWPIEYYVDQTLENTMFFGVVFKVFQIVTITWNTGWVRGLIQILYTFVSEIEQLAIIEFTTF